MCCNIPKMAATPLDSSLKRGRQYSHKKQIYLIKSYTKEYLSSSIRFNSVEII